MLTPKIDCGLCKGGGMHGGKTCRCIRVQDYAMRIRQAVATHGKLFERSKLMTPGTARQSALVSERRARAECLLVRADWPIMLRHLLCCVVAESVRDLTVFANEWNVRVTSDLRIRESYFGERGQAHLKIVDGAEVLVVRLGMTAKNAANAPALYEVLMAADDGSVPVWLVESAGKPFKGGHPSWSDDIGAIIEGWPKVNLIPAEDDTANITLDDLAAAATEVEP